MIKVRLKEKTGSHYTFIPGHGRVQVRPGEVLKDKKGKEIEIDNLSVLGSQKEDFVIISGNNEETGEEKEERQEEIGVIKPKIKRIGNTPGYNVVNETTGVNLNDNPLTKKQAKQLLESFMVVEDNECPLQDGVFGETWNEFEECPDCPQFPVCEKESEK